MRIGYLIGQFPAPTHTFIWRDVRAIERQGIEVELLSTRPPITESGQHSWALEAIARTTYLVDSHSRLAGAVALACFLTPRKVFRCISIWASLIELTIKQRVAIFAMIAAGARLAAICKSRSICHVHVPFPANSAYVALFAKLLGGIPFSLASHGTSEMFGSGLNLPIKWRHASFGAAITVKLRQSLINELAENVPRDIVIAPMGVEIERFSRNQPYMPWTGMGPIKLFSCGRGVVDKGHLETMDALSLLVAQGLDAHLRIGGEFQSDSWFTNTLLARISKLQMTARVTLMGALSEDKVIEELENCHVFVLATRDEGLGVAIMEAMAMQVPVVSTTVGGVPVLVDSGIHGILVPKENPVALATAIIEVLRNPEHAREMGENGRTKVMTHFTSDVGARTFIKELKRRY